MPMPTEPVKRVCYADDLTVWATGVEIPDMEHSLNSYLDEITEGQLPVDLFPKVVSNIVIFIICVG